VPPVPPVSMIGTFVALVVAGSLGVFAVFIMHVDIDDTFYVNRASWVAQYGTIPIRDTLFTNEVLPAIRGAGVPVSSIETFQGAIGHALHLSGGTAVYLLTPSIAVFLAVWAVWRLIREWAARRQVLCMAVAVAYLLFGADHIYNVGGFFLARAQQGKSIFVAMLVPLLFVYLTRWAQNASRRNAVLLTAAGVAAVGFTSSATFLVPLICATVALPLVLLRRYRLAVGCFLPSVYPFIVGVVVHFTYSAISPPGSSYSGEDTVRLVFGPSWFGAIGWLATLMALWLARPGAARYAVAGVAGVLVIVTAPGAVELLSAFTGASAVLWRIIWLVPLPVLVGVAAGVRLPVRPRWAGAVPALVLVGALALIGTPIWASKGSTITSQPTWKYPAKTLAQARAVARIDGRSGPVLAPRTTMQALALVTARLHAVDPRTGYIPLLDEPIVQHEARISLLNFVKGSVAPRQVLRAALTELNVSIVCLPPGWKHRAEVISRIGYRQMKRVPGLDCYQPRGNG
jgi:hypothetical protein